MSNKISQLDPILKINDISENIFLLIKKYNLANEFLLSLNISCLIGGNEEIIYYNTNSNFIYFIDDEIDNAFLLLVKDFFKKEEINTFVAYQIINCFTQFIKNELFYFKLFNLLNWQSSKKGLDYYNYFNFFSKKLKNIIKEKSINLSDAVLFHKTFVEEYDEFFDIIPSDLSCTEMNILLRNISEYSKRNKIQILKIIEMIKKQNFSNKKDFSNFIESLRFPLRYKYFDALTCFIKDFNLPKNAIVLFDKTFETKDHLMNIKFKGTKDLLSKIKNVNNILEKKLKEEKFKDLFLQEELFNDKK